MQKNYMTPAKVEDFKNVLDVLSMAVANGWHIERVDLERLQAGINKANTLVVAVTKNILNGEGV